MPRGAAGLALDRLEARLEPHREKEDRKPVREFADPLPRVTELHEFAEYPVLGRGGALEIALRSLRVRARLLQLLLEVPVAICHAPSGPRGLVL